MFRLIVCLLAFIYAGSLSAQNTAPLDSFVTKSGIVHKGWLIEDNYPKYFRFKTTDETIANIPYSIVANYYFGGTAYKIQRITGNDSITNKALPYKFNTNIIPRRNTGIVLTGVGSVAFVSGIAIIAANPKDIRTYSNQSGAGVLFKGTAAAGFIVTLLSPALFITGSVLWAKASHQLRGLKRSQTPRDL